MTPERRRQLQQLAYGAGNPPDVMEDAARQLREADGPGQVAHPVPRGAEVTATNRLEQIDEASGADAGADADADADGDADGDADADTAFTTDAAGGRTRLGQRAPWVVAALVLLACAGGLGSYLASAQREEAPNAATTSAPARQLNDNEVFEDDESEAQAAEAAVLEAQRQAAQDAGQSAAALAGGSTASASQSGGNVAAAELWFAAEQHPEDIVGDQAWTSVDPASTRYAGGAGSITDAWVARGLEGGLCLIARYAPLPGDGGASGGSQCVPSDMFEESGITSTNAGDTVSWDGYAVTFSAKP